MQYRGGWTDQWTDRPTDLVIYIKVLACTKKCLKKEKEKKKLTQDYKPFTNNKPVAFVNLCEPLNVLLKLG
jgi:hypothetical protein